MVFVANKVFINGRFLTQNVTGVQRFAREIVSALDRVLVNRSDAPEFILIAPKGTPPLSDLSRISFTAFGERRGHLWEQIDLRRATRGSFLINLGPSGPLLKREQLTIIHDAAVYRHPQNYSFAYGIAHRGFGRILARSSKLGTVSEFSRQELADVLKVHKENIALIPDGYEHSLSIPPEDAVLDRLALRARPYFLFVGSMTPNKNLTRAIKAFVALDRPDVTFVIVGGSEKAVYRGGVGEKPTNVVLPGRLSDGEIVSLYRHATALVFPSLYEGFGIPPLEAMTLGCPVIASRIPPVEEVCGDAALYFDPLSPLGITDSMRKLLDSEQLRISLIAKGMARFPLFSWAASARSLLDTVLQSPRVKS